MLIGPLVRRPGPFRDIAGQVQAYIMEKKNSGSRGNSPFGLRINSWMPIKDRGFAGDPEKS